MARRRPRSNAGRICCQRDAGAVRRGRALHPRLREQSRRNLLEQGSERSEPSVLPSKEWLAWGRWARSISVIFCVLGTDTRGLSVVPAMNPVDILKDMFQTYFGAPAREVFYLSAQLGGSARRIVRLSDGTSTAIGVLYDVREENVAFVEFSRHFHRQGLPVPEIYAADLDRNAYLEEDLGNVTLFDFLAEHRSGDDLAPEVLEAYRTVVGLLTRFQVEGVR